MYFCVWAAASRVISFSLRHHSCYLRKHKITFQRKVVVVLRFEMHLSSDEIKLRKTEGQQYTKLYSVFNLLGQHQTFHSHVYQTRKESSETMAELYYLEYLSHAPQPPPPLPGSKLQSSTLRQGKKSTVAVML